MSLPALAPDASPEFVDPGSCRAWIEDLPLANVGAAQSQFLAQLEELNRFPTSAANRLAILETLREAVNFVQIEQAKRFTSRPLPMAPAESEAFEATRGLWREMQLGYLRCQEAALGGDTAMRAQAALVSQRLLAYIGLGMFHHYRAYREVPASDWGALNSAYARAEALGVAEEPVKDFLNRDVQDTSARIAFARAVLMGLANPHELAQRQITFVAYLLERWASKLEVSRQAVDEGEGVSPLVVDLEGEGCPVRAAPAGESGPGRRILDARKLAKSLRNRVALLRKGESPAKLGLGEDCVQPSCEQLLVFLYRQWCQAKPGRALERRGATGQAQVCSEFGAVYYHVSGRAFRPPGGGAELTQMQSQMMETLGRVSTRHDDSFREAQGFVLEQWQIVEESAQGLRLVRPAATRGRRYGHGQLIAVRPADAKQFILGQVRWLTMAANGDLHAGVRLLPGLAAGVAARATGLNMQGEKHVPALTLSAVPALKAPQTLLVPPGWYKPKRVIELLQDESTFRVRLTEALERGTDFERVAYEKV